MNQLNLVSLSADYSAVQYEAALVHTMWNEFDWAITLLETAYNQPGPSIETNDKALYYRISSNVMPEIAYQLGYLYGRTGNIEKSQLMSESAIRLDSNKVEAYINLANVHLINGNRSKALEILDLAESKFPNNENLKIILNNIK